MTTYQDKKGKVFNTRAEAKQSNLGTIDNTKTNTMIDSGKLPETQRENVPQSGVINSDTLTSSPDFNIKPPKTATGSAGIMGAVEAGTDAFTQAQTDARKQAEKNMQAPKSELSDFISQIRGETGLTAEAYAQKGGVDSIQPELDSINQQIKEEQMALRRKKEAIDAAGGGLQSGAQAEKANLDRESAKYQADLYVIQQGVQGRYDSAKAIADRAVSAYMEQQKIAYDAIKFNYEENKDLFTKAEQREFDTLAENRKREMDKQEADLKEISDLSLDALTNGAPTAIVQQMRSAKTPDEAMALGGSFIGKLDREGKIANIAQSYASIRASNASAARNEAETAVIAAKQKQIEDAVASGVVQLDSEQQKTAMALGKQFEDESKTFKIQANAYNQILASAQDASAAGDLSLIFGYMKMLDPNSVVRETEFANAQNAAGVPEIIRAKYNQALRGERLSESTRTDFVDRAAKIYGSALDQQVDLEDTYSQQGTNVYGLPKGAVDLIIRDIRAQGAVSDVAFGLTLNNLSDEQLLDLSQSGLLTTPTGR